MKMLKALMMLVCLVLLSGLVHAASIPVSVDEVTINGVEIDPSAPNRLDLEIGQDINLRVKLEANADAKNIQVEAFISGYEYSDFEPVSDSTHVFDVEDGVVYIKRLKLSLPEKVEKDSYKLRLIISDRYSDLQVLNYNLLIDRPRHSVKVTDVWFTPENKVMAGEYLIASVRLKNYGNKDESGLKVEVSIPDLGVSAVDYVDEVEAGDSVSSEELYLRIPKCNVKAGEYEVDAKVTYDNGYEMDKYKTHILIGNEGTCETTETPEEKAGKIVIALESNSVELEKGGKGAVIPITITNKGTGSQTIVLGLPELAWATFKASPSNVVVLDSGETKTVYVYVTANKDAVAGEQSFSVSINNADGESLKELTFKANVKAAAGNVSTARVLEIILIVLIAILVLIGLIIGFKKLMGKEEEAEEEASAETYY